MMFFQGYIQVWGNLCLLMMGLFGLKEKNIDYNLSEMKKKSGQGKMVLSFQWKRLK